MKKSLLLIVVLLPSFGFAKEPKESDYPMDFVVSSSIRLNVGTYMTTLQGGGMVYTTACQDSTHRLESGVHGCKDVVQGEHLRGRVVTGMEKDPGGSKHKGLWIGIFWVDEKGKPRTQEWTVSASSPASP
jgi:hypothetical protein